MIAGIRFYTAGFVYFHEKGDVFSILLASVALGLLLGFVVVILKK